MIGLYNNISLLINSFFFVDCGEITIFAHVNNDLK